MALMMTLIVSAVLSISSSYAQSRRVIRIKGGKKTFLEVKFDTTVFDSLTRDSLLLHDPLLLDSLMRDSLAARRLLSDSLLKDSLSRDSLMRDSLSLIPAARRKKWKDLSDRSPVSKDRFSFTKDTISPTAHFLISLVPGLGQVYNGQWYKTPIFVGMIGGFVAGGVVASGKYNACRDDWKNAVNMSQPQALTDPLERKMRQQGTVRTLFYSAAAATYLYQIADATFNYRGYLNPVRKATILACVFPGAGFLYTKTYWRLPIYYGGFAAAATVVDYNSRHYQRYLNAYNAITDNDPTTEDEFHGRYSADALANARDGYRRDRDLGIICMFGVYVLSIIDTYVTATLKNWDVTPELSMHVEPVVFRDYAYTKSGGYSSGAGLSLKLRF